MMSGIVHHQVEAHHYTDYIVHFSGPDYQMEPDTKSLKSYY